MNENQTMSRLRTPSPSRREIDLEISPEEFEKEYEKILGDYSVRAKLPGFRKGHAPKDMVKRLFDHDIRHDVYDSLIPRALERELEALDVKPVNTPAVRDLRHDEGQPVRCTAAFEVLPEFELPDYRSIRIPARPASVEEAEVDKALEELRSRASEYVPVEGRGVEAGDYVVVEMQGRDLRTRRLLPAEKAVVLAGHSENEPALNEQIIGMTAGEARSFRVTHAADHPNKRVAGKEVEYALRVREIKAKKVPELNDEFARSLGDSADLAALRDRVRRELSTAKEKASRNETASEVLREIGLRLNLELPESAVESESVGVLRRLLAGVRAPKLQPDALEVLRAQARRQAVEHLTNHLILEKIAREEGLGVTESEIREEIQVLALANRVSPAAVEDMLKREGRREEFEENILFRKTVDFLVKNAIIG